MAPKYKLTYFTLKGLGEPIRFLLAKLGADFEDERISFEDWPKLKPNTPWGKMPYLEVDGETVTQTKAICRYLGREAGLAGATHWEDLRIDEAVEIVDEFRDTVARWFWNKDPAAKEKQKASIFDETLPFYLTRMEAQANANGGFLANGKLSWADFYLASLSEYMSHMVGQELLAGSPALKRLVDGIFAKPEIKAYIARRPPHN